MTKTEIKKGWKIIERKTRNSCWVTGDSQIKYEVNKKVRPNPDKGPLCLFRTREQARHFLKNDFTPVIRFYEPTSKWKIVKCEYRESMHDRIWGYKDVIVISNWLPKGTILAAWIKCLE